MSFEAVERITKALLYEGYLLYPYRASALKNRQRWLFGRVLPRDFSLAHADAGPWAIRTECLLAGSPWTQIQARVRFLQLAPSGVENCDQVPETIERELTMVARLDQLASCPRRAEFAYSRETGLAGDPSLEGALVTQAVEVAESVFKLTVAIENLTPCEPGVQDLDRALLSALLSTHTVLLVNDGEFISLLDPPKSYAALAETCCNIGAWPVLVGPQPGRMLLSAPIILEDYPQIAPESPGDLFDGTEIDELLTLRIKTLTDQERQEMIAAGEHSRSMLQRTESLTEEQFMQLHGRLRSATDAKSANRSYASGSGPAPNCEFAPGDRVRLQSHGNADAFDALLIGQTGTVTSIEYDFEQRVHLSVVMDDDPGKDFGLRGHPGHRFFFSPEDLERLSSARPQILLAGIGNELLGDDGFGVEVVRQFCQQWPVEGVRAFDFGIRGFDLACAILDGYDAVVLVDAVSRGGRPGTLYVIEPELGRLVVSQNETANGHAMSPEKVLEWVRAMGGEIPHLRLIGCEPGDLGSQEEPRMGLSAPVAAAVREALRLIQSLVEDFRIEWARQNEPS